MGAYNTFRVKEGEHHLENWINWHKEPDQLSLFKLIQQLIQELIQKVFFIYKFFIVLI